MVVIFHSYVKVYQKVTYSWDIPESYSWFPLSWDIPKNHGSDCHGHVFGDIPDPPVGYVEHHPTAGPGAGVNSHSAVLNQFPQIIVALIIDIYMLDNYVPFMSIPKCLAYLGFA